MRKEYVKRPELRRMTSAVSAALEGTDEDTQEVVLKRAGDKSRLSLIVGKNLFQMVRYDKRGTVMHEFAITRSSVTGFRHRSFEALNTWRNLLVCMCMLSFIFISPITSTWTAPWFVADIVFLTTLTMLLFTSGNPHILVFNAGSESYSVFFFQWFGDRDSVIETLSNVGVAMSTFLVSREFSMPNVTYNIGRIGDNIGRIGDTVATDSVVMEEQVQQTVEEE